MKRASSVIQCCVICASCVCGVGSSAADLRPCNQTVFVLLPVFRGVLTEEQKRQLEQAEQNVHIYESLLGRLDQETKRVRFLIPACVSRSLLQQQAHIDSALAAQDADFAAKLARGRVS